MADPARTPGGWLVWEEQQGERYDLLWDRPIPVAGHDHRADGIVANVLACLRDGLRGRPYRVRHGIKAALASGRWANPDAIVRWTPRSSDETVIDDPVVLVEVVSPGRLISATVELRWAYQDIESLQHLVLIAPDRPKIEVASRGRDESWRSSFHAGLDAEARLDALGLSLPLAVVYDEVDLPSVASAQNEAASEASTTAAKA